MKRVLLFSGLSLFATCVMAQNENADSISTKDLNEVVIEGQLQSTSSQVSTYIPTSKQKNASQTATELLNRMAIPQLSLGMGGTVQTTSGKDVAIYIDFVEATEQDLTGMRMVDVKKVEYYDYPKDPRFQGAAHVINFIMHQYEYGGYVKAFANEFFIANAGQLNLYSKFQYKKMTYDLGVGGYYNDSRHTYDDMTETYRLPQPDGSIKEFERYSVTTDAKVKRRYFWPTFRALYSTDKITISNSIGATFDNYPKDNTTGKIVFNPSDFPETDFVNETNHRENYVTYDGNWNFILPHGNTINFRPYYSYTNTRQDSRYVEDPSREYINSATDYSHKITGNLRYQHDFGKWGDLSASLLAGYTTSKTKYSGTASQSDHLSTLRIGPGVIYSFVSAKLYARLALGLTYDCSKVNDKSEKGTRPFTDVSLQYAFNKKNSLNLEFHYQSEMPDASYRSNAVIQSNPLMRYTGNPNLTPYKGYDFGASYQWLPNNKFSFSVFGYGYVVANRFAYVYEASADGILRGVRQPLGNFSQGGYGVNGSARLIDGKLQISGQLTHQIAHGGAPFNWNKSHLNWYLQAYYYLNQWQFGLQYQSRMSSADGFVKGTWVNSKDAYSAIIGWGNSSWNLQAIIVNPFRWNWKSGTSVMTSKNYDYVQTQYTPNNHCFVYVSATYTFGYGKKVMEGNEAYQMSGAGSAILK